MSIEEAIRTYSKTFRVGTRGNTDVLDISDQIFTIAQESKIREGMVHVSVAGSTAGITSIEYESGVVKDLQEAIDRIAPKNMRYYHDVRWGDGNGYAHVRAALIGSFSTFALTGGNLFIGTWQQIVLIDFDNRPRSREILVQVIGSN
jgi:secondary thiamine-phosphate synthase enzyme